jgi:hypothetical protein
MLPTRLYPKLDFLLTRHGNVTWHMAHGSTPHHALFAQILHSLHYDTELEIV